MIRLTRTIADNHDFKSLVAMLDAELALRDGEDHAFYNQFNSIQSLEHCLVLYTDDTPVGCGAIKQFDLNAMEVKRMFVVPESRGKSLAKTILSELENWAKELGYTNCILETGKRQPEAIALYQKSGYTIIPNYGQYAGIDNSVCFRKKIAEK